MFAAIRLTKEFKKKEKNLFSQLKKIKRKNTANLGTYVVESKKAVIDFYEENPETDFLLWSFKRLTSNNFMASNVMLPLAISIIIGMVMSLLLEKGIDQLYVWFEEGFTVLLENPFNIISFLIFSIGSMLLIILNVMLPLIIIIASIKWFVEKGGIVSDYSVFIKEYEINVIKSLLSKTNPILISEEPLQNKNTDTYLTINNGELTFKYKLVDVKENKNI